MLMQVAREGKEAKNGTPTRNLDRRCASRTVQTPGAAFRPIRQLEEDKFAGGDNSTANLINFAEHMRWPSARDPAVP
jgi:hypothetical protein